MSSTPSSVSSGPRGPQKILQINSQGSDGDGRKWPKHTLTRNDRYYLEKLGELWIKDLPSGPQPGVVYVLDRLPNGYAGFQKPRPNSKHVDRYVYGHPRGIFRSLTEFYPHFKQLMDYGNTFGCECKLCTSGSAIRNAPKAPKSIPTTSTAAESRPVRVMKQPEPVEIQPRLPKRKLEDIEGSPDVYEHLIEKLKVAGPEQAIDESIEERLSPDWRTGSELSRSLFKTWQALPQFVPRIGEVVLFVRKLNDGEIIAWNEDEGAFCCFSPTKRQWLDPPTWEAGVITQMPEREVSEYDLLDDAQHQRNAIEAGFRIEPLSQIGAQRKPHTPQHKYVLLHMIRPLSLWSECASAVEQSEWHPTIKHALTITNSLSLVGRYRFKGRWPQATVFCRGAYIGGQLIMVGDIVKLNPRPSEQDPDVITDVMQITAIRFRFINLDLEQTGLATPPSDASYQTCLHFSGRVFTQEPTRSFDGVGKVRIDPKSDTLPAGISDYGKWYYYHDPAQPAARLEIPFTRILAKCPPDTASKIWFRDMANSNLERSVRAGGLAIVRPYRPSLQDGSEGASSARAYSLAKDSRIKVQEGRSWFWADTRIEQLDLHEVNNRSVGKLDLTRTKGKMAKWRISLKVTDGKAGAVTGYQAAKRQEEPERSAYGILASSAVEETGIGNSPVGEMLGGAQLEAANVSEDEEDGDDHLDNMELDDARPTQRMGVMSTASAGHSRDAFTSLGSESSDESEDSETNDLAARLAMNIRPNNVGMG